VIPKVLMVGGDELVIAEGNTEASSSSGDGAEVQKATKHWANSIPNAKWVNLMVLLLMALGYRILLYLLLRLDVRKNARRLENWRCF
jgi:hypothetical protein